MSLGWTELLFLGILALALFGQDLPQVARDVGRLYQQLRRTVRDTLRF